MDFKKDFEEKYKMKLKKEYEDLSKQVEYRKKIGCNPYGCRQCSDQAICSQMRFLEKYHKDAIK